MLKKNYNELFNNNILLKILKKNPENLNVSMSSKQLIILFDDIIFHKCLQDINDYDKGIKPSTYQEFLIEYLYKKHKSLNSVIQSLSKIIKGIEINKTSSNYINLLANFLQLNPNDSINNSLLLFFSTILMSINKLTLMSDTNNHFLSNNFHKPKFNDGGLLLITDIFDIIFSIFSIKKLKFLIIYLLRSRNMSKEGYILYIINYLLYKASISADQLFDLIALQDKHSIPINSLVKGLKKHLKM